MICIFVLESIDLLLAEEGWDAFLGFLLSSSLVVALVVDVVVLVVAVAFDKERKRNRKRKWSVPASCNHAADGDGARASLPTFHDAGYDTSISSTDKLKLGTVVATYLGIFLVVIFFTQCVSYQVCGILQRTYNFQLQIFFFSCNNFTIIDYVESLSYVELNFLL